MKILSVNAGSSSLKFKLFELPEEKELVNGTSIIIHSAGLLKALAGENAENAKLQGVKLIQKRELYNRLSVDFTLVDALTIGRDMGVSERTINNYLREMMAENIVKRVKHGMYEKSI